LLQKCVQKEKHYAPPPAIGGQLFIKKNRQIHENLLSRVKRWQGCNRKNTEQTTYAANGRVEVFEIFCQFGKYKVERSQGRNQKHIRCQHCEWVFCYAQKKERRGQKKKCISAQKYLM